MKNYSLFSVRELLVEKSSLEGEIQWEEKQFGDTTQAKEDLAAVESLLKEKGADATSWWK